eukprot:5656679-Pyramimonas_sp.AAC.1
MRVGHPVGLGPWAAAWMRTRGPATPAVDLSITFRTVHGSREYAPPVYVVHWRRFWAVAADRPTLMAKVKSHTRHVPGREDGLCLGLACQRGC